MNVSILTVLPNILQHVIPGYKDISPFVTPAVSAVFVLAAIFAASKKFWENFLHSYVMARIYIYERDPLFAKTLNWISNQPVGRKAYQQRVVTKTDGGVYEDGNTDLSSFHYGRWVARKPSKYELNYGKFYFFYDYRPITLKREQKAHNDEEHIILETPWSHLVLKDLIETIKISEFNDNKGAVVVRAPGDRPWATWSKVSSHRRPRSMDTVILDKDTKKAIATDLGDFLLPATAKWYAERGVPYRRGYLFHGPSGTGKSSLSLALAAMFGLDVYLLVLGVLISDSRLRQLFSMLPSRCIILLEDVDAAGLDRDGNANDTNKITYAGFLNVIDGIGSREGVVLVMTTNKPGKLDGALIRPGRVDKIIEFKLATKAQARELFISMYCRTQDEERLGRRAQADEFANKIPENSLSPASLQGYLISNKDDLDRAVREVGKWVEEEAVRNERRRGGGRNAEDEEST